MCVVSVSETIARAVVDVSPPHRQLSDLFWVQMNAVSLAPRDRRSLWELNLKLKLLDGSLTWCGKKVAMERVRFIRSGLSQRGEW